MKKLITLMGVLLCTIVIAQTSTITYTPSSAVISNPERGFYKFTSAKSTSYQLLNQTTLTNYRLNNNITLLYREFRLEDFKTTAISQSFLDNMQTDFNRIRNAGLKCIIRFTYSNSESASPRDASKATILAHLLQLQPYLQANVDVISVMQAGFIGVWGEWYYTSQAEFGGEGYNGSSLTTANINNRRDVVNAMLNALPSSRMVQVRTPAFKRQMYSTTALPDSQSFNETNLARVGHFNDCFLASSTDYGTYVNPTIEYPYLMQETKFLPMGGETCALNSPRSDCASALLEMEKFHWSYLNLDYYPGVIDGFTTDNCFTDIQKKLGYRFELTTATLPQAVSLGMSLPVTLKIRNQGYASLYNERNAYIVLKNLTTNQVYPILMSADPRTWLGTNEITITENLTLPANITAGNYKMYLSLPDSDTDLSSKPEFSVQFANQNVWESATGYNSLNHTLSIVAGSLAVADNTKFDMNIYPIPAKDKVSIELESINDYTFTFYNALGQKIATKNTLETNKLTINTQELSDGLYFIEFSKGAIKDTRKIIVRN